MTSKDLYSLNKLFFKNINIFSTTFLLVGGISLFGFFSFSGTSSGVTDASFSKKEFNSSVNLPLFTYDDPACNWINNDEFDNGTNDWVVYAQSGSSATWSVDNSSQLSGTNSAYIDITSASGTDWHVEFNQAGHSIVSGTDYSFRFDAKADANRTMGVIIQQNASPYTIYHTENINLTTTATEYGPFTFTAPASNADTRILFRLGTSTTNVYIDDVIFGEESCFTSGGGSTTISSQISSSSDDAEEDGSDGSTPGSMYTTSSDLELVYDPNSGHGTQIVGMRFNNLNIPQGATISDAYITFTSDAPDGANPSNSSSTNVSIAGQDIDNAPIFTTANSNISSRTTTSSSVNWTPSSWTTGSTYNTPSLTTIVQEIIDRPGWTSGNSMAMIINGTNSGGRVAHSYDGVPGSAPILNITYSSSSSVDLITGTVYEDVDENALFNTGDIGESGITVSLYEDVNQNGLIDGGDVLEGTTTTDGNGDYTFSVPSVTGSITSTITSSTDDARELRSFASDGGTVGSVNTNDTDLDFGSVIIDEDPQRTLIGMRFQNITVPQGASITNAYLRLDADGTDSSPFVWNISGENVDNATTYSSCSSSCNNLSTRAQTATVSWSGEPGWTDNTQYDSPDISSIVQAIINRSGWSSGNAMAIMIEGTTGTSSDARDVHSFDNSTSQTPPQLIIEYEMYPKYYVMAINTGTLPLGGALTTDNIETTVFNLAGSSDTGNNFGFAYGLNSYTILGKVYEDVNTNATYDGGEVGESGVTIQLYQDNNQDGLVDGGDTPFQTTTTDINGDYSFNFGNYVGSISQSSDDAREKDNGDVEINQNSVTFRDDGNNDWNGLRFTGLTIPSNAIISSAHIYFTSKDNKSNVPSNVTIYGQDGTSKPTTFAEVSGNISSRARTSASEFWSLGTWSSDIEYQSPDLSSIVQEIVTDQTGLNEEDIAFLIEGISALERNAFSWDDDPSFAPRLEINYTLPGTQYFVMEVDQSTFSIPYEMTTDNVETAVFSALGVNNGNDFGFFGTNSIKGKVFEDMNNSATYDAGDIDQSGTTVRLFEDVDQDGTVSVGDNQIQTDVTDVDGNYNFYLNNTYSGSYDGRVIQSSDDARDDNINENNLKLGKDRWIGVRFQGINIPSGAVVTNAYVEFNAKSNGTNTPSSVTIRAHDVANAPTFIKVAGGVSGLTQTSANQFWTMNSWATDNQYQSPDISNVINELLTSYGEYSNESMAFIFEPTGSEEREADSWDENATAAPRLVLTYTISTPNYYVMEVDASTLPTNYNFTTDNIETAVFSAAGSDTGNDFGFITFNVDVGADTTICDGSSISLTATPLGGIGSITYTWDNGLGAGASHTVSPTVNTTYSVTATDGVGLTVTDQILVNVASIPSVNAGSDVDVCEGGSTTLTAVGSGGTGAYTYTWDNGLGAGASHPVNPSVTTTYTVTVTDQYSCSSTDQVVVNVSDLNANAGSDVDLCTGYSATLNAIATGGTGTYTSYVWDNGLGAGSSKTVSPVVNTTYSVTITDSNGCTDVDQMTVTIVGNPPTVNAGSDVEICNGGNTLITATPSGGTGTYSYSWDNGLGTSPSHLVSPTSTTNYNVTVSDGNGCTDTDQVIVTVNDLPIPNAGADVAICPGGNTTLTATASSGSGGYTYSWNNGLGAGASKTVSPATNTIYIVTVTDSKGCTSTDAVGVTINPPPTANAGSDVTICDGENTTLSASGTGGSGAYSYSWDNGLGAGAAQVVNPSVTTIYSVTITDGNGCTDTDQMRVIVNQLPEADAGLDVDICNGESATLTATASSGSGGGYTYVWSNGLGAGAAKTVTPSSTTFYNVTVTDGNGCTDVDQVLVIVNPLPVADAGVNQGYCPGGNSTITATASGGDGSYSYVWDNGLGAGASKTVSPSGTVTYTVTVTDGNGCTDLDVVTLTPIIVSVNAGSDVSICPGDTTTLTAVGSGGDGNFTYSWSDGLGSTASVDAFPSANTTYTVTVTDGSGCTATDDVVVSIYNNTPTINPSVDVTICEGDNITISTSATGGVGVLTYTWSDGLGNGTSKTVSPISTTTYSVTVTDGNGCEDVGQIEVTVTPPAVINMNVISNYNGEDISCVGASDGSAQASPIGSAPFSYNWSSGNNTSIATNLNAGTYTVTVTDGNTCTSTATITLSDPPAISGSAAVTSDYNTAEISCNGGSDGEVTATPSGGVSPHTYLWNDPFNQTSATASSLEVGTYTVTITDANGCTATTDVTISEPTALSVSISKNDAGCPRQTNGDATATPSGGTAGYTYVWSSGGTAVVENNLGAGTYTVTVTDANGCTSTAETTIIESSGLAATTSTTDGTCALNNDGSATVTPTGGVTPYTYAWSSGGTAATENNLAAGTYTVTVTDSGACSWEETVSISSLSDFDAEITGTDISCFEGNDGTITVSAVGGIAPYDFAWDDQVLEAQWTFENTTDDVSGNNHDATSIDGTESYSTDAQEGSNSINFNGSTRVQYSVNSGFMTGALTQQTVMMWVKPDALSGEQVLFEQGGADHGFAIRLVGNEIQAGVAKFFGQQQVSATFPDTDWHLVAATYDNGELTLFLDGTEVATLSTGFGTIAIPSTRAGGIGGIYTSDAFGGFPNFGVGYDYYTGLLDDIKFYDGALDSLAMAPPSGEINYTRTGLRAGNYVVTVTDAGGCLAIKPITLSEPAELVATPDSTIVGCNGGNDGEASVLVTGGTFPYTYSWSSGGNTDTEIGLTAGTYTVTITDDNACTVVRSINVNEPAVLNTTLSDNDINCFGANDGTATATPSGGTTPYSYLWSNGGNSSTINNLLPGTYTVTVTDGSGCTSSANTTISEPTVLTASASISSSYGAFDISCYGASDGTATASQVGGTAGYSYEWSNGQTVANLTNASAGTYTVTVTDNNNCTSTASVVFSQPSVISLTTSITSDYNGMDISCMGAIDGTASAVAIGGAGTKTYSWTNGDNTSTASGLGAGTYTVVATDGNGCTASATVTLQDPALSVSTNIISNYNGSEISCVGGSDGRAVASGNNGAGGYLYQWNTGATGATATNLSAGTYTVTTTDINGCTATANVTVNDPTPLTATPAVTSNFNGSDISCFGANDGDVAANAGGGAGSYTYQWSNSSTGASINNVGAGTYTVTITDDNGCTVVGSTDVVSPNELTVVASVNTDYSGNDISCAGASDGEVLATPSGGTTGYSYSWTSGDNTNTSSNLNAGTYTVVVTDANGCTASATVFLQDPPGMNVNVSVLSDYNGYDISCPGGADGSVFASATNGAPSYAYSWGEVSTLPSEARWTFENTTDDVSGNNHDRVGYNGNISYSTDAVGGSNSFSFDGNTRIEYAINDNFMNSGFTNRSVAMWIKPSDLNGGRQTLYDEQGDRHGITLRIDDDEVEAAVREFWNEDNTDPITIPNDGLWHHITMVYENGNLTVFLDGVAGTTENTGKGSIPADNNNGGLGGTFSDDAFGSSGSNYYDGLMDEVMVFNTALNPTQVESLAGSSQMLNGLSAGTYTVTVTDANGCTMTESITLTDPPAMSVNFTKTNYNGTEISCPGASDGGLTANVTNGYSPYSYSWSTGDNTNSSTGLPAGTYTVTITDSYGCTTTSSSTLSDPAPVNVTSTVTSDYSGFDISCAGDNDGTGLATPTGGTGNYTYLWSDGQNTAILDTASAQTYFVTVTDENGCTGTSSISFSEPTTISVSVTSADLTDCDLVDGAILITATGGIGSYEYRLDAGAWQSGNSFSGLDVGTYNVYVRSSAGSCQQGPYQVTLDFPAAPTINNVTILHPTTSSSNDGSLLIDADANGSLLGLEYRIVGLTGWQTSNLFENIDEGTYTIEVGFVSLNCVTSTVVTLTAGAGITLTNAQTNYCSDVVTGSSGVETYYIPFPEDQANTVFRTIYNSGCGTLPEDNINTYVSVGVVAANTIIYYDHWEDNFESNINFPIQGTTETWGDGNTLNGFPPGYPSDVLNAGDIIVLENVVFAGTTSSVIDFDGGDKMVSNGALAVTRLAYPTDPGTLYAGALEVYSVDKWGTAYEIPIGESTDVNTMFEYTGAVVMAKEDGTILSVDLDGNGTIDNTYTINEGRSQLLNNLNAGAEITSSAEVQVHLITGDVCASYETRWFTLTPTNNWSDSYFNAVDSYTSGGDPTYVHLYNPNSGSINVVWETNSGVQGTINVSGDGTAYVSVPDNTGSHFYTTNGDEFYAVATIDSEDAKVVHDWGYALLPEELISSQITMVGFAPGFTPGTGSSDNTAPIWVTGDYPTGSSSTGSFTICIDYDGDGGSFVDGNGVSYDAQQTLNPLDLTKIFDPDNDQTGMRIWVCDGSDALLAGAWGQDPEASQGGGQLDELDLGTGLPNGVPYSASICVDLLDDKSGNGLFEECDVVEYTILINNTGVLPLSSGSVTISDTIPLDLTYLENSTTVVSTSGITNVSDETSPATPFPLDEGGYNHSTIILPGDSILIKYQATVNQLPNPTFVQNEGYIVNGSNVLAPSVTFPALVPATPIIPPIPPADTLLSCEQAIPVAPLRDTLGLTFSEVRTDASCINEYILTRTWTATDYCGNIFVYTQVITVEDNDAPTLSGVPLDVTVDPENIPVAPTVTASDNCDATVAVNFNETTTPGTCDYVITRTWDASDVCGNSVSRSQTITVESNMIASVVIDSNYNGENISCEGDSDGAVTASATGGTYPLAYSWSNLQTDSNLVNLSAGTYTVVITDATGCTASANVTLTQPTLVVAATSVTSNYNGAQVTCPGASDGIITASANGGTPGYSYSWSTGDNTQTVIGVSAGTYTVTVTDLNGCDDTETVTVIDPTPINASANIASNYNGQNISCIGENDGIVLANATGGSGAYTYAWSNGSSAASANSLIAGTYTVTISDANGCSDVASVTLSEPTAVAVSTSITSNFNGENISCPGASDGDASASASGGNGAYAYAWNNGQTGATLSNVSAGTYTVTATDNNGCSATNTVTLTEPTGVNVSLAIASNYNGNQISCVGGNDGTINSTSSGGTVTGTYSYAWDHGPTTQNTSGLSAGTYTLVVTDDNGCTASASISINDPLPLSASLSVTSDYNGADLSCAGASDGSVSAAGVGGTPGYTYVWSGGLGAGGSKTNLGAGTYTVTITDINGCTASASTTISAPAPLNLSTSITSNYNTENISCAGASDGNASSSPSGGTGSYSYSWSNGQSTNNLINVSAGTYTLTVTDANGCTAASSVTFSDPTPITISASVTSNFNGRQISCNGASDGTATSSASGGTGSLSYSWSNGQTVNNATNLTAGTYTVIATDANGCTASTTVTLTQPLPVNGNAGPDQDICVSESTSITTIGSGGIGGYTYVWNNGLGAGASKTVSPVATTTYTVTVTDNNGCTDIDQVTITINNPPVANAGSDVSICDGDNTTLIASATGGGGYSYVWSNGLGTGASKSVSPSSTITYAVTVTDGNGCTDEDQITVTVNSVTTFISSNSPVCLNSDINLGVPAATSYSWSGPNSFTSSQQNPTVSSVSNAASGLYSVTVTDAVGCTSTAITNVVVASCTEDCSNGVDDDGDGLIDCMDCDDCATSASCTDNDNDGIGDFCDLDDDNDGIPDFDEGGITGVCPTVGSDDFPSYDYSNCSDVTEGKLFTNIGTFKGEAIDMIVENVGGASIDCGVANNGCNSGDNGFTIQNSDPDSIATIRFYISGTSTPIKVNWAIYLDDLDEMEGIAVDSSNLTSYVLNSDNNTTISRLGERIDFDSGDNNDDELLLFFQNVSSLSFRFTHNISNRDVCFTSAPNVLPDNPACNLFQVNGLDSDGDGIWDHLDLDSDNDGIFDVDEAGHGQADANDDGVIDNADIFSGNNGLFDGIETVAESGVINYSISDSETSPDGTFDAYELDSDGDGCLDAAEANVVDGDLDGIAGSGVPTVDANGLVTSNTYISPANNNWQNPLIGNCLTEDCTDGIDNDADGDVDCDDSDCAPVANNATLSTCDNSNLTGSGTFFLHDANPTVSSESGVMISYHPTLLDAQNGTNILISPYTSSDATVYARVERVSTGCFATSEITLDVGAKCAENCNNGIDDDGDGLIDCDDPDCPCCAAYAPTLNGLNKKDP